MRSVSIEPALCAIYGASVKPPMAHTHSYHWEMQKTNYRKVLAVNVQALMASNKLLNSHAKLAKAAKACASVDSKIGARTIGHLVNPEGPFPRLDTIIAVADAFKVAPWELMYPDFAVAAKREIPHPSPEILSLARRITTLDEVKRNALSIIVKIFSDPHGIEDENAQREVQVHPPQPPAHSRQPRHKAKA